MQDAYDEYCEKVRNRYCDEFWRVFSAVYEERVVTIDRVLGATREVFVLTTEMRKRFETSVRQLRERMRSTAGDFAEHVLHEISVDLSKFDLPDNIRNCKFRFVNPLWAWVQAANDMISAGKTMHCEPKTMVHEVTGER